MRRVDRVTESMFGIENSTVDPNRFYSILLDARAASVSENMCDIAEKLLQGEKDNAKTALEQLWRLKKNLFSGKNGTIDLLITYYQEKMDLLRGREEHLRKVSVDSRNLLEEKRKKDEEVAMVKQQVMDCTREIGELTEKLEKLKVKEQELTLIEHQLREELNRNENEIVNGLYEIILTQQEEAAEPARAPVSPVPSTSEPVSGVKEEVSVKQHDTVSTGAIFEPPVVPSIPDAGTAASPKDREQSPSPQHPDADSNSCESSPFPKSVVKTSGGKVIGEYHYDGQVYKNERHYLFNSAFFARELIEYTQKLKARFELSVYSEMLQMVQDAAKRTAENKRLHFEVATNEILNEKTIKRLWQDSKLRSMDEVERFGVRLRAKIEALGNNYVLMLREQMERYAGNP